MEKTVIIAGVIMSVLILGNCAQGDVSVVANGSFEDDSQTNDITVDIPVGWHDVYLSNDNYNGLVGNDWSSFVSGGYSLTLYSMSYHNIEAEGMIMISQQVYLEDVNHILFDIKLGTEYSTMAWDETKRTAILLIDDNVVWSSDELGATRGTEYAVDVNESKIAPYKDDASHTLSLALKSDVDEYAYWQYWAQWDFVRFDTYCEGLGYLPVDFDFSCIVDMNDLKILAEQWLTEMDSNDKYNLYWRDDIEVFGIINFLDFAAFAETWDGDLSELGMFTEVWLSEVDPEDEYNLYRGDDTGPLGVVNFRDYAIFADSWQGDSYGQGPGFLGADINNDGIVNFYDYAILVEDWDLVIDYDAVSILAYEWLGETGL